MATAVVYVHGLWMVGIDGALLRRRLSVALSATTPFFRYRSVSADMSANARTLASHLSTLEVDTVHLVGHSLGGLVILKMFEDESSTKKLPPGRVVLLGSPVCGSRAAQSLAAWRVGIQLMGRSAAGSLLATARPRWEQARELGVIAGNLNVGIGRIVNSHRGASDGTVFVDETHLNGAKEHLVVRVNHMGLPLSSTVASHTARFLREGNFLPPQHR